MNYQIKLFHWPERGDHGIIIVRGFVEIVGFKQMFCEVGKMTASLCDSKVLIDLVDASYGLDPADIKALVCDITPEIWPVKSKIALVSTPQLAAAQSMPSMFLLDQGPMGVIVSVV